jgi:Coenzyme PQQ synthesis protein D (PqqD)
LAASGALDVTATVPQVAHGTLIERNARIVHRNVNKDQGSVLLHLDSGAYHGINEVGTMVWDLIESPISFEQLLITLRERLGKVPSTLDADIAAFVKDLEKRDLLRMTSCQPQP